MPTKPAALSGVVFDAYGTLFDVYSVSQLAEQLFPDHGASLSTLWRDKQIEYSRLVSLSDPSPAGSRYYQSFWELTRLALQYSLQRLKVEHSDAQIDTLMASYAQLQAFAECQPVLQQLRGRGLKLAVLSNGSPAMLQSAADHAGLSSLLDDLISVDAVRQFKTSPSSYAMAPQRLGVPAHQLLFVSSNAWDVLGATWFGYRTCWINRQGLPCETLGPKPEFIGQDLRSVLEVLNTMAA